MDLSDICVRRKAPSGEEIAGGARRCGRMLVWLIAMVFLICAAGRGQQADRPGGDQAQKSPEDKRGAEAGGPAAGRAGEQQPGKQNGPPTREERNRQIVEDSARLLKLVTDLKIAMDSTTMDTLSIGVIRKADEIEKLAKSTREKVKQSQDSAGLKK